MNYSEQKDAYPPSQAFAGVLINERYILGNMLIGLGVYTGEPSLKDSEVSPDDVAGIIGSFREGSLGALLLAGAETSSELAAEQAARSILQEASLKMPEFDPRSGFDKGELGRWAAGFLFEDGLGVREELAAVAEARGFHELSWADVGDSAEVLELPVVEEATDLPTQIAV